MSEPLLVPEDPAVTAWMRDLEERVARGEVQIQWSRVQEPRCIHTEPGYRHRQPASACRYCKDGKAYLEWVEYWRGLGAPE